MANIVYVTILLATVKLLSAFDTLFTSATAPAYLQHRMALGTGGWRRRLAGKPGQIERRRGGSLGMRMAKVGFVAL
eukprot:3879818-Alexandrium_andersonii.AAC.1